MDGPNKEFDMEINSTISMDGISSSMMPKMEKADPTEMSTDILSSLDSDENGQLSAIEFAAGGNGEVDSSEMFDALDTDEDGYVSQAEQSKMDAIESDLQSGGIEGVDTSSDTKTFSQPMVLIPDSSESQSSGTAKYSELSSSYQSALSGGLSLSA